MASLRLSVSWCTALASFLGEKQQQKYKTRTEKQLFDTCLNTIASWLKLDGVLEKQ